MEYDIIAKESINLGAFIRNIKVPIILFIISLLLTIPFFEEMNDASDPNYGIYTLYTLPFIAILSVFILIIQLKEGKNKKYLLQCLLVFNSLIVLGLAAALVIMALGMII